MDEKEKQQSRKFTILIMKGILLLNALWLGSTFVLGMMEESSDVNAAGMHLVATIPHLILFNIINFVFIAFLVAIIEIKTKIQVLLIACLLLIALLVILQSPWLVLMEIWIGFTFMVNLWIITHPHAQIRP